MCLFTCTQIQTIKSYYSLWLSPHPLCCSCTVKIISLRYHSVKISSVNLCYMMLWTLTEDDGCCSDTGHRICSVRSSTRPSVLFILFFSPTCKSVPAPSDACSRTLQQTVLVLMTSVKYPSQPFRVMFGNLTAEGGNVWSRQQQRDELHLICRLNLVQQRLTINEKCSSTLITCSNRWGTGTV